MQNSRSGIHAMALGLVIVGSLATAQGPQGHGRLDDPFLDNLVGTWSISRQIRGTVVENSMEAQWALNHQFVQLHMRAAGDPPGYEALVLVGYDPNTARYVAHWCDDFGGQYSAIGYGKRSGNAIEFTFAYADGPFHNTFTWDPSARGWTFLMQSEDAKGQRRIFGQDTVRKK
jgi:hypothetical protein